MSVSQKTMRSFFQITKANMSTSSKKPRMNDDQNQIIESSTSSSSSSSASSNTENINEVQISNNKDLFGPSSFVIDDDWKKALSREFTQPYFKSLIEFVNKESEKSSIYPPRDQIFSAFNLCSFDDIKVV